MKELHYFTCYNISEHLLIRSNYQGVCYCFLDWFDPYFKMVDGSAKTHNGSFFATSMVRPILAPKRLKARLCVNLPTTGAYINKL